MAASSIVRQGLIVIVIGIAAYSFTANRFLAELGKEVANDAVAHEQLRQKIGYSQKAVKGLGAPGFACPASLMARSKDVPTNAHQVRPADIKVVAALGDSLTAGNGAGATTPIGVLLQYRGLAFSIGSDLGLDEHVTIANILTKFNPTVYGASTGIGAVTNYDVARLNAGVPGAQSSDLPAQARDLVAKMQAHNSEVNINEDWKLVNIFIGGNDMCAYCQDSLDNPGGPHNAGAFRDNIRAAIQILYDQLPRTIVNLVGMLNMKMLRTVDAGQFLCQGLHQSECPCEFNAGFTDDVIGNVSMAYMMAQQELEDQGIFDNRDDFTLVIQPFFEGMTEPPMVDGHADLSYFAPDCFHFSQLGHAAVAKVMWNNMLQPVGAKNRRANLTDLALPLSCPNPACPFILTTKNSRLCVPTPPAL